MRTKIVSLIFFLFTSIMVYSQCFLSAPLQVCAGDCGPVFYLTADPPGTTYAWSIDCGTITNPTAANPHTACFITPGVCTIHVIVSRPGETPDTCTWNTIVSPTSSESIPEIICEGDSVEVNGTYYTAGIYMDTIFGGNVHGCDSFLIIVVAEIPPMLDTISTIFCAGSGNSIIVNGTTYNESNPSGTEYILGGSGCVETIVTVDLIFAPASFSNESYVGCQGDGYSVTVDTSTYDESNPMGVDTLVNMNGCDSIVTTMLVFNTVYHDTISYLGCTGDSFSIVFDSVLYNELNPAGTDTFTSINGCDSIFIINLVFMSPSHDTIMYEGCMGDGYTVTVLDSVFDESNPTGTVIIPTSHCDSIVFVDLVFADCPDSLVVTGHEVCVSGNGSQYSWYSCYGIPLPDTTQCITLGDTGCICVRFTDGTGFDTLCMNYNLCDLNCEINGPDSVCVGDSVLITFSANDSSIAFIEWTVMLDSSATQVFTGTDSIWLVYYLPGCYTVQVQLQDSGCLTFCYDTICVYTKPIGNLCCDHIECDSCVPLMVSLIGTPPFSFAISDGSSIDTVSGIYTSVYNYQVCPPHDTTIIYTLLWVTDSTAACNGALINNTASVYLEQRPTAGITVNGNTLCATPNGFAYGWYDCANTSNLSFNQCFVPTSSGCYCVTVSTLVTDCTDSACVNFILSSTHVPDSDAEISFRYDPGQHSIIITGIRTLMKKFHIQLHDILGRNIAYQNQYFINDDMLSISLFDNVPSLVFISIHSEQSRITRGVFIPGY